MSTENLYDTVVLDLYSSGLPMKPQIVFLKK